MESKVCLTVRGTGDLSPVSPAPLSPAGRQKERPLRQLPSCHCRVTQEMLHAKYLAFLPLCERFIACFRRFYSVLRPVAETVFSISSVAYAIE